MLYEQSSDIIARRTVVFECLQDSARYEIDEQSLAFGRAIGGVILETIFGVPKVMALLVYIVLSDLVVLWRLSEDQHGGQT